MEGGCVPKRATRTEGENLLFSSGAHVVSSAGLLRKLHGEFASYWKKFWDKINKLLGEGGQGEGWALGG